MRYWEDFITKFGFEEGSTIPDGFEVIREMYVTCVNTLAAHNGSKFRVVPYDRGGLYNPYLIVPITLADYTRFTDAIKDGAVLLEDYDNVLALPPCGETWWKDGEVFFVDTTIKDVKQPRVDEEMDNAIAAAYRACVDSYWRHEFVFDRCEFDDHIAWLTKEKSLLELA